MSKLKILLLLLFVSLSFACKSAPKSTAESEKPKQVAQEKTEQPEQIAEQQTRPAEPVQAATPAPEAAENDYIVYFAPLAHSVDRFTAQKLNNIGEALAAQKVKRIIISGHSAKLDSEKEEERVALQRAIAVAQHFHEMGLFDTDSITIEGKGAREPVASHSEITDRFKNRTVKIQSAE